MSARKPIKEVIQVPREELENIVKHQVRTEIRQEIFQGPLPHPDHLKKYDEVCPGAAEKIVSAFISQSKHRMELETKVVDSNIKNEKRGQVFAFIIALIGIGAGILLLVIGKEISGFAAFFGTLASLTAVFIVGKKKTQKELQEKK